MMRFGGQARAVLSHANCRRFLLVRFLLMTAAMMIGVVIGWQVWDLTQSTRYLGYAGLAEFIPNFLFALPAGQAADRYDRRYIILACVGMFGACTLGLLLNSLMEHPSVTVIFVISAVTGLTRAYTVPANQSLLPILVPEELFPGAVTLSATAMKVATILGPFLGGVLILWGTPTVYGVAAGLFLAAFWAWLLKSGA